MDDEFLRANANSEFISSQFYLVLIDLLRAVAANDSSASIMRAAKQFHFVLELIGSMEEPIDLCRMLSDAVEDARDAAAKNSRNEDWLYAARSGTQYLTEIACRDGAARGRASKRLQEFERALRILKG